MFLFLVQISDTRVSRNHGLLENLPGQLRLKPVPLGFLRSWTGPAEPVCNPLVSPLDLQTHVNPCFVQTSLIQDPRPLEKDRWFQLHHGDLVSLLPGRFVYRVEAVDGPDRTPRY